MVKQHLEENLHKRDNVVPGTHEDKDSVHVEQTSINKHTLGGFDPNNGFNNGSFLMVIQLTKFDKRKFDGKGPMTWIFQMEQYFDLHEVPNLQKVTIASLYLEPKQFVWYQWLYE